MAKSSMEKVLEQIAEKKCEEQIIEMQIKDDTASEIVYDVTRVTLDSVLNRGIEENMVKDYYCEPLGGNLELKRLSPEKIQDTLAEINQGVSEFRVYQKIVYLSCDLFQRKEVLEKYPHAEPYEVVYQIMGKNIAEINIMAKTILEWYGFDFDAKKQ